MICFIHIERAGGTTLHYMFRHNYFSFVTLTPWYLWTNEKQNIFTAAEAKALFRTLPFVKAFGGHTARSYLGYESAIGKPIEYVTFVREPISRYLSHFRYQNRAMGIPWTIDEYLNEPRFDNFMTRRIAGTCDLDLAKQHLMEDYQFVGLTGHFDESLVLMKKYLGVPNFDISYSARNAGLKDHQEISLEPWMDQIREKNALDIELYRFAEKTLFPRFIERYGQSFKADVDEFRRCNVDYRFSRWLKGSRAMYRMLIYRNIEYVVKALYHDRDM